MTASRVTPPLEEEGAEVEGAERVGRSVISVRGRFGRSWTLLRRTGIAFMTPMTKKRRGESGILTKKCQGICVIAEGKISLSRVAVSL